MNIKRYDIVQADLSPAVGSEQGSIRLVLIIQNNVGNLHSSMTIVMPFFTKIYKNPNQPTHTLIKQSRDIKLPILEETSRNLLMICMFFSKKF